MSNGYTPPIGLKIPFEFGDQGYSAPDGTDVRFKFAPSAGLGALKAAVNVMQPYWYETHTYPKSCPKYVIGYGPGGVQIIKGSCVYGGIRDLQGTIAGLPSSFTQSDVSAYINIVFIKALGGIIDTHFPVNLTAILKSSAVSNRQLPAYVHSWELRSLGVTLAGTHDPVDMPAQLYAKQREERVLNALIRAWHAKDLTALMGVVYPSDLNAAILSVAPVNLPAFLRVHPQGLLTASTRGWGASNIGAYINQIWDKYLPASIVAADDTDKFLPVRIRGYGSEQSDLSAFIRNMHWRTLGASVRATYLANLPAYLYPVQPVDLSSRLYAWHASYLQVIINVDAYPWDLPASIYPRGYWRLLTANIYPVQGIAYTNNLIATVRPWSIEDFPAYIFGDSAHVLSAYINTIGYSSSLQASIKPKMIRLTTVIDIPTLSHSDLSAIINFPCKKTGYAQLMANLYVKFKGDLSAYIRPIIYDYKPRYLGAKVGYTDAYLEVDKLKLGITIYPDDYMTEDKIKLVFNFLNAELVLSAYIRGTLRYEGISAYINAEQLSKYVYTTPPKNRERVIHKTYDGVFKQFETVEMAFKSSVEDYFYSSAGKYAWKEDMLSKWMLSVKSILPTNTALRLRRRLHRATTLYDLSKFDSVDEAMKFAIAYVTEYPQGNLSASIFNRGTYTHLAAVLNPRYVKTERNSLSSTITSVDHDVVVSKKATIEKI